MDDVSCMIGPAESLNMVFNSSAAENFPTGDCLDVEMLVDPSGLSLLMPTLEDSESLNSEPFRQSNSVATAEQGEPSLQPSLASENLPKKNAKKRKTEKNGGLLFSQTLADLGSTSIPSPCSSVITSSSVAPARPKPNANSLPVLTGYVAPKDKDRSLIYVNYLNAFANSLTVHPPWRRTVQKIPTAGTADDVQAAGASVGYSNLDFEMGGVRLGQTTAYFPDMDRDRCGHIESFCPFSKRDGYSYCEKHLLDDKGLPFVPCAFQRLEANPCPYPARMPPGAGGKNRPQRSKEALCSLHMEKCMQEVRQHMSSSANALFSTMDGLAAYNSSVDKGLPPTNMTDILEDLAEPQTREYIETYLRATAKDTYASSSSSEFSLIDDNDVGLFRSKTFDTDDELDSEEDEPLKYAHNFSIEELTRLLRSKIAKQKELLAGELRLQEYKLKDARARYLTEVMEEKSFLPSVHTQARLDPESCTAYRNIRSMMRLDRKRPRFSYANTRKPCTIARHGGKLPESVTRCLHMETGTNGKSTKCKQYSLPFSRHCLSHILEDQFQYLYKRCAAASPSQCSNPILKNMGVKYCYHHTELNITRSGPDLNTLNDSHTQGSSSSEADPPVVLMEAMTIKTKKSVKVLRKTKTVFLPTVNSPKVAKKEGEMLPAPQAISNFKEEGMEIDESQPEPS